MITHSVVAVHEASQTFSARAEARSVAERAGMDATDAHRVGLVATELATNLAYEIAVTEKTVTPELQYAAASTIALMRDRALARHDAQHVRAVARTHGLAAHTLVPAMRAQHALLVEQPLMPALSKEHEEAATKLALLLIGGVRQAARTPAPYAPPRVRPPPARSSG